MLERNATLNEELMVEMANFSTMRERMVEVWNKNKAFCKHAIVNLQKMCGKYLVCEQEANNDLENTHP